ncbi:hypothetical protein HPB47_008398 [Ixodes persulcatus]|uniref:Uncharacterized protein n=1 Tax=Ixodes persulcatus TaxID=34615 RepID=A0AC60P4X7_IXOPE|nr:hypothetical protein HPB47_008398 [Ixodes persulcatus]
MDRHVLSESVSSGGWAGRRPGESAPSRPGVEAPARSRGAFSRARGDVFRSSLGAWWGRRALRLGDSPGPLVRLRPHSSRSISSGESAARLVRDAITAAPVAERGHEASWRRRGASPRAQHGQWAGASTSAVLRSSPPPEAAAAGEGPGCGQRGELGVRADALATARLPGRSGRRYGRPKPRCCGSMVAAAPLAAQMDPGDPAARSSPMSARAKDFSIDALIAGSRRPPRPDSANDFSDGDAPPDADPAGCISCVAVETSLMIVFC